MKKLLDRLPILCVIILMAVCLLPMMIGRDYSPANELRYLNIVDEAISNGNVFAFTNQGEAYADKPPFYFWLMMLCKLICGGHNMLALSLLSFIPACVMIAVMDRWLCTAFPERFSVRKRVAAALMLATSGLYLGMSVFLRMDMLMCMWIVLAMWTFWKMDNGIGNVRTQRWLLPIFIFMALFTKGPVGLLVPPLAIVVYLLFQRRGKDIFKYLGIRTWAVIAALCAFWFAGVFIDGGKDYLNNLLFHQTVGRAVNSFHHKAPVWFYIGMIWAVLAPWCLAVIPSTVRGLLKGGNEEHTESTGYEKLFTLTVFSTFVMLSCFSSKLAIYLAPVFPFAVYLFPAVRERNKWDGWSTLSLFIPSVLFTLIGVILAVVSVVCSIFSSVPEFLNYPFLASKSIFAGGLVLAAGGLVSQVQMTRFKGEWERPVSTISVSMLVAMFFISLNMSSINDYVGYGNMCKLVPEEGEVYTLGVYRPENMDVYIGRDIYSFDKDVDSFLMLAPKKGTLLVSLSTLGGSDALIEYLEDQEFEICGPYAVYTLNKITKKESRMEINNDDNPRKARRQARRDERRSRKNGDGDNS